MKSNRNSGIELLRIIAALMVVMLHYNYSKGFENVPVGGGNYHLLNLFESISIGAVNVFVLISGYFSCKSFNRCVGKPLNLLIQSLLFGTILVLLRIFTGSLELNVERITKFFVPMNYFIVLYVALYIISPYFNKLIQTLSQDGFKRMLLILGSIFCIYETFISIGENLTGFGWSGASPTSHWGAQMGHTIVLFSFMYMIGAYLRLYVPKYSRRKAMCSFVVSTIFLYIWFTLEKIMGAENYSSLNYFNPIVIWQAISLFLWFRTYTFYSNFINKLAGAAFICYLLQFYIFGHLRIPYFVNQSMPVLLLHIVVSLLLIYGISYIVLILYNWATKSLFNRLDNIKIQYKLD